jgi:hypothetical protein
MPQQKWNEMSQGRKAAIVVMGVVEVALTTVALVDLVRRPAAGVRGPKVAWVLACAVQPIGPIAYLAAGRIPVPPQAPELGSD